MVWENLLSSRCVSYVKGMLPWLPKLDDCNSTMVFIGFDECSNGYRVYDLVNKCVHVTRDAIFDEESGWDWVVVISNPPCNDFIFTKT